MDITNKAQAKIYDRLVNPVSVSFPIAFFALCFATFLAYQITGNAFWYRVGYFTNVVGVFAAVVGSLPWLMDWTSGIPKGTHLRMHSARQGIFGIISLALFAINWLAIRGTFDLIPLSVMGPLVLTGLGVISSLIAGYHAFAVMAENRGANLLTSTPTYVASQTYDFTKKAS